MNFCSMFSLIGLTCFLCAREALQFSSTFFVGFSFPFLFFFTTYWSFWVKSQSLCTIVWRFTVWSLIVFSIRHLCGWKLWPTSTWLVGGRMLNPAPIPAPPIELAFVRSSLRAQFDRLSANLPNAVDWISATSPKKCIRDLTFPYQLVAVEIRFFT